MNTGNIGLDLSALLEVILLSVRVSGVALLISTLFGIPLGAVMGLTRFWGRRLLVVLIYTGMGLPPVVVGLFVYLMLSRSGPLGALNWPWLPALFTPAAMIVAQIIIATPLVAGFTMAAVMGVDPELRRQIEALGATPFQRTLTILMEARLGVIVSIVAGFGGIISEVGAVMLVGGNIDHKTRVLTTAIVLETRKGNFDLAIALGAVLLALAFVSNLLMMRLQGIFDKMQPRVASSGWRVVRHPSSAARHPLAVVAIALGCPHWIPPIYSSGRYAIPAVPSATSNEILRGAHRFAYRRSRNIARRNSSHCGAKRGGQKHPVAFVELLEAPSGGVIQFEGQPYCAERAAPLAVRRRITTVFQRPAFNRQRLR
ncbi:MAG: ABC transporter permease [Caldilineaceae bacterium]